jgi:hypothetical protein
MPYACRSYNVAYRSGEILKFKKELIQGGKGEDATKIRDYTT